jgi:hypothetical protein
MSREAGDLLALDRVALVGHRARALLPGTERLFDLAHLRALQMPDLGREALQPGPRERDRAQQLGVPVARDDLRGDVLALQPEPLEHARLELGAGRRVGPHGARHRPDGNLREGALQAQGVPVSLEREARELHAEGRRLCMHAVRPADAQRLRVLSRACDQRGGERAGAGHDHLADGLQLQPERGVEHVRGGQPEVNPASRLPRRGGEHVDERRHVVVGHLLALVHGLDGERRAADRLEILR